MRRKPPNARQRWPSARAPARKRGRWRGVFVGAAALFGLALGGEVWIRTTTLPPLTAPLSARVVAADGTLLRAFTAADGRWRLAPRAVDPDYLAMLLAYEDKRFYGHPGVDPIALIRATLDALWHGRVRSGGSTLTMQVARLLEAGSTGRWAGKRRQIRVALALERHLTKAEILAIYLTRAPFGGNIEGVEAALLSYFGSEPHRLTAAEAAFLVAVPQAPEARRPDRAAGPGLAAARARVLKRAVRAGLLTPADLARALSAPLPRQRHAMPNLAPHLSDRLRRLAPEVGVHATTLDADLQKSLETLARAHVRAEPDPALSAAIMVADHATGAVLARVGAAAFGATARRGWIDMTRAVRSPGSTLKPLIYGLAFETGRVHPATLIEDRPQRFGPWRPSNFDGTWRGWMPVAEALRTSRNLPAIQLLDAVGPVTLTARLRRLGITPHLPGDGAPGLAIGLGGVGMTLEDLLRLYAGLARPGPRSRLHETPGSKRPAPAILGPVAAAYLRDALRGPRGIALKTGTSYGHRDAWALGYDGRFVVGVWLGRADAAAVPGLSGQGQAAPLLRAVFQHLGAAPAPFPPMPSTALTLPGTALAPPLRRFGAARAEGLRLVFPPDGARVDLGLSTDRPQALVVKLADGRPPFRVVLNGHVLPGVAPRRTTTVQIRDAGFHAFTLIDALGDSVSGQVVVE
ncbi:MAG: penicillin-binding protein 1C [Pseudomonadota bacterium]